MVERVISGLNRISADWWRDCPKHGNDRVLRTCKLPVKTCRSEPVGIESRWGPPDLDEVSEDPPQLVGILYGGDDLHVCTPLWTHERIDLVDLRQKSGPGAFA